MANQEKDNFGSKEQFDDKALEHQGDAQRDVLQAKLESASEHVHERSVESARAEALEQATRAEREVTAEKAQAATPERKRAITKKDKEQSFDNTMHEVRTQLSPLNRSFSKVIHQPAIEKTSEVIGSTLARPNAILSGSLCAFILTAALYIIARFNGYPLSGTEAIASFVVGWLIGLLFDYLRILFIGKR
jgi:flagellar biosynthesis/type III secretory pathway protein FliH